jgi:hypothetical protein
LLREPGRSTKYIDAADLVLRTGGIDVHRLTKDPVVLVDYLLDGRLVFVADLHVSEFVGCDMTVRCAPCSPVDAVHAWSQSSSPTGRTVTADPTLRELQWGARWGSAPVGVQKSTGESLSELAAINMMASKLNVPVQMLIISPHHREQRRDPEKRLNN